MEEQNNGQKTEAQKRLERYKKNPEDFAEINELVLAVKREEKGQSILVRPNTRYELHMAFGELSHKVSQTLDMMDMSEHMEKEKQKKIVTADNKKNFRNFLRRRQ